MLLPVLVFSDYLGLFGSTKFSIYFSSYFKCFWVWSDTPWVHFRSSICFLKLVWVWVGFPQISFLLNQKHWTCENLQFCGSGFMYTNEREPSFNPTDKEIVNCEMEYDSSNEQKVKYKNLFKINLLFYSNIQVLIHDWITEWGKGKSV